MTLLKQKVDRASLSKEEWKNYALPITTENINQKALFSELWVVLFRLI